VNLARHKDDGRQKYLLMWGIFLFAFVDLELGTSLRKIAGMERAFLPSLFHMAAICKRKKLAKHLNSLCTMLGGLF